MKLPNEVKTKWVPVPRRSFRVEDAKTGHVVRAFDTDKQLREWMHKEGYDATAKR